MLIIASMTTLLETIGSSGIVSTAAGASQVGLHTVEAERQRVKGLIPTLQDSS